MLPPDNIYNEGEHMTTTETRPTVAALAAEMVQLRAELAALRSELSDEVRTRRLVVVDEFGVERISTALTDNHTWLRVAMSTTEDKAGLGGPTDAHVVIAADLGECDYPEGAETCSASVTCTTGDDSYAILRQIQLLGQQPGLRRVVERGSLELDQRVLRPDTTGQMIAMHDHCIELGCDGVTETSAESGLLAFAPMQAAVRS